MFLYLVQEKTYSIVLIFSSPSLSPVNYHVVDIIQTLFQTVAVISNGCCYYSSLSLFTTVEL